jgi:hypothetical protein
MSVSDENLAQLFSQAKKQQPVATLDETKTAFITASAVAVGSVLASKGLLQLLTTKKWIIMLSTVSIITTGTIIASLATGPAETTENTPFDLGGQNAIITLDQPQETTETVVDASPYLDPAIPTELTEVNQDDMFELIEDESDFLEGNDFIIEADVNGIEFKTTNPAPNGPKLAVSNGEIKSYSQRFDITEKTSKEDFENIKKDAEKDGVDFFYKAKYDNGKLKKLRLELKLDDAENGDGHQYIMSSMTIEGEFNYTIAWDNAEKGTASKVYMGHTDEFDEPENDIEGSIGNSIDEFANMIAELNLEGLFEGLDSLAEQMANEVEFEWVEMEEELAELENELEEAMEEFKKEDIAKLMEELKMSSADMVKVIQEELEQIQIELEKEKEALEKEKQEKKDEKDKKEKEDKEDKEEDGTRI